MEKYYQFKGIIYLYRNKINNKVYVGQTIHEKDRKRQHKNSIGKNTPFARAIKKYGFKNFAYKVLFRIGCRNVQDLINTLNSKEINAIKYYDSTNPDKGYNITKGGSGTIGVEPWNKGKRGVYSEKHIEHLKQVKIGTKLSKETKIKISDKKKGSNPWNKGRKGIYSEEVIQRMRESHKKLSTNGCEISINQYDINGVFIKSYPSIKSALINTGINNISGVLRGKRKTAGGFVWKYAS